jgi:hypothetical protein
VKCLCLQKGISFNLTEKNVAVQLRAIVFCLPMRWYRRRDHLTHELHILRILSDFPLPRFAAERVFVQRSWIAA